MPLDFNENHKEKDKKATTTTSYGTDAQLRRNELPRELEKQVVPDLIKRCGDWKSGRLAQPMVEAYMDKNVIVWDRELLTKMFAEADFKKEGSLSSAALIATISGRYAKREHTTDWRRLVAVLLGYPTLVLTIDEGTHTKRQVTRPPGGGTFNSETTWESPPPPLPPVAPSTWRRRTRSAGAQGEWAAIHGTLQRAGMQQDQTQQPVDRNSHQGPPQGSGTVLTPGGRKQAGQIGPEMNVNQSLGAGTGLPGGGASFGLGSSGGFGIPRSTFGAVSTFTDFAKGLEVVPQLASAGNGLLTSMASEGLYGTLPISVAAAVSAAARQEMPPGPTTQVFAATLQETGGLGTGAAGTAGRPLVGTPKPTVKAMDAVLPPSAIVFPTSHIQTLRQSVRSTLNNKPEFARMHRTLDASDLETKKTLGQDMEMSRSLARVEPVRGTHVPYNASYTEWADYKSSCRTAPTRWHNEHPAVLQRLAAAEKTGFEGKYPWC